MLPSALRDLAPSKSMIAGLSGLFSFISDNLGCGMSTLKSFIDFDEEMVASSWMMTGGASTVPGTGWLLRESSDGRFILNGDCGVVDAGGVGGLGGIGGLP